MKITEYTDTQRANEFKTETTPHLVTKSGRISQYGMACGYIYLITTEFGSNRASLKMSGEHGVYSVDYFSIVDGTRTKGFSQYDSKNDAERHYRKLAKTFRKSGTLTDTSSLYYVRTYSD